MGLYLTGLVGVKSIIFLLVKILAIVKDNNFAKPGISHHSSLAGESCQLFRAHCLMTGEWLNKKSNKKREEVSLPTSR